MSRSLQVSYSLFLALLFLFINGYQFNSGDMCEHLPPIYQLQDPELYKNDFFMTHFNQTFTVRQYYVWFVYALSLVIPIQILCFGLVIVCLFLTIFCWININLHFSTSIVAAVLSPILIFFVFYKFTIGGNMIQYNMLTCSVLAKSLASLGLLFYLKNRYYYAFLILGIVTLFQVLVGFQLFIILIIISCFNLQTIGTKKLIFSACIYGVIATFILVPLAWRQLFANVNYDQKAYQLLMFKIINPHHFLPSSFPLIDYTKYCFIVILGIFLGNKSTRFSKHSFFVQFLIIQFILFTAYIICVQYFDMYTTARFQWAKTTIWVTAFSCIFISIYCAERFLKYKINQTKITTGSFIGSFLIIILITNANSIPIDKFKSRYIIGNYVKTDLTKMHEWIYANTYKNAVFLTFPEDINFGCEAKRSTCASPYAMIHEPFYAFDWYKTMQFYYQINLKNCLITPYLKVAQQNYCAKFQSFKKTLINYRLDNLKDCKYVNQLGPIVYQKGDYILTKVND